MVLLLVLVLAAALGAASAEREKDGLEAEVGWRGRRKGFEGQFSG